MPRHTDREYAARLHEIRERLIAMAGRVEQMINHSVRALIDQNVELAQETIDSDYLVNRAELETDEMCTVVLAMWQPMGRDLRLITFALKTVTDLERMADLAVNICERAIDLSKYPQLAPTEDIPRMSAIAQSMTREAIDAFVHRDTDRARGVIQQDDELDILYSKVFRDVLDAMAGDKSRVTRGIHVQSVAKWLERLGDHATNIAERVIYMVEGTDVRHYGRGGIREATGT